MTDRIIATQASPTQTFDFGVASPTVPDGITELFTTQVISAIPAVARYVTNLDSNGNGIVESSESRAGIESLIEQARYAGTTRDPNTRAIAAGTLARVAQLTNAEFNAAQAAAQAAVLSTGSSIRVDHLSPEDRQKVRAAAGDALLAVSQSIVDNPAVEPSFLPQPQPKPQPSRHPS